MPLSLIWLPDVLKNAGLKVATVPDWEDRGSPDSSGNKNVGTIFGVICHHTGVKSDKNMPTLDALVHGRKAEPNLKAIPGPLAQLGLGRDGTYYIVAAGRCNHAGVGIWRELDNGNTNFIGIEAENSGGADDFPWPTVQMDAYHRGVAAILEHIGKGAEFCAGHKEYALPPKRKDDPSFDMNSFRTSVSAILNKTAPQLIFIPPSEPANSKGRSTLRRGIKNDEALVKQMQTKLGVEADGSFGPKTEAAMRAFQRRHGLVPDGIVGPKTWSVLDTIS
ncbi:MAG: N-acetyl-anhydromuramyl-L-alanine amidase AmpD [Segetibacter sp.]|nr:N-acetyl-anhydromuramyl-L-alanine amidase AmpD [Segetibacter sp.]